MTVPSGARPADDPRRTGAGADEMESLLEMDEDSDWNPAGDGFELARAKANENLAAALVEIGWSAEGARVVARACVKPDDVAVGSRHLWN